MCTAYLLPNDQKESERLDVYDHMMGIVNGGRLHRAPLNSPQRILDIGTGTGKWAIDIGEDFLADEDEPADSLQVMNIRVQRSLQPKAKQS